MHLAVIMLKQSLVKPDHPLLAAKLKQHKVLKVLLTFPRAGQRPESVDLLPYGRTLTT